MADISWGQLAAFAPQLAAITDTDIQTMLVGVANESLEPNVFGGESSYKYMLARLLLGAHEGMIILMRGDVGKASSESISKESLTVSYASGGSGDSSLKLTDYGSALEEMIDSSPARLPIVV